MNRLARLLAIAFFLILILVFVTNPQLLEKFWLWIIGFIGYFILLMEKVVETVKIPFTKKWGKPIQLLQKKGNTGTITSPSKNIEEKIDEIEKVLKENFPSEANLSQHHLTVLRYLDDGQTTLGLLFLKNKFFAYTMEDSRQEEKSAGETRIPQGVYPLELDREETELVQKYRNRFPWFLYHIEIKKIPQYSHVYIHVGNTHEDTRGSILIADGMNVSDTEKMIAQSQLAYGRFYKILYPILDANQPIHIQILNEDWFDRCKLSTVPQVEYT